jgi:DNA-binding transcriptional ArsR family regulator
MISADGNMTHRTAATPDGSLALRARFFRGLADPSRLALLEALRDGERSVSELVAATGLTQSNASGHLACLRECGLVETRQAWRHVFYRLASPHLEQLFVDTDRLLSRVAERIEACQRPHRTPELALGE